MSKSALLTSFMAFCNVAVTFVFPSGLAPNDFKSMSLASEGIVVAQNAIARIKVDILFIN